MALPPLPIGGEGWGEGQQCSMASVTPSPRKVTNLVYTGISSKGKVVLSAVIMVAFIAIGIGETFVGPALNYLTAKWGVSLGDGGILFTSIFFGSCVSISSSSWLMQRIGIRLTLFLSLLLLALGLVGMAFTPGLGLALVATLSLGLGLGGMDVILNLLAANIYPSRQSAMLNLVNVFFGVGALTSPLLVRAAAGVSGHLEAMLLGLSGLILLTALAFALLPLPTLHHQSDSATAPTLGAVLRDRYVLALMLTFFLYVGMEVGFGGWAVNFAIIGTHLDLQTATLLATTFWLSFTLGRLVAAAIASFVPGHWLIIGGALLAAAGGLIVAAFNASVLPIFVGAVLVGVGCAPIFPTSFAQAAAYHSHWAALVSSLAVLGGMFGGAVLPFIQGQLLTGWGVWAGAGFTVLIALAIIVLQLSAYSKAGRVQPASAPDGTTLPIGTL